MAVGCIAKSTVNDIQVVHQITVRDHHPFGCAGGAGGVLEKGQGL